MFCIVRTDRKFICPGSSIEKIVKFREVELPIVSSNPTITELAEAFVDLACKTIEDIQLGATLYIEAPLVVDDVDTKELTYRIEDIARFRQDAPMLVGVIIKKDTTPMTEAIFTLQSDEDVFAEIMRNRTVRPAEYQTATP